MSQSKINKINSLMKELLTFSGVSGLAATSPLNEIEKELLERLQSIDTGKSYIEHQKIGKLKLPVYEHTLLEDAQALNILIFSHYTQLAKARWEHELTTLQKFGKKEIKGTHGYDRKKYNGGIDGSDLIISKQINHIIDSGIKFLNAYLTHSTYSPNREIVYNKFNQCLTLLQTYYLMGTNVWAERDAYLLRCSKGANTLNQQTILDTDDHSYIYEKIETDYESGQLKTASLYYRHFGISRHSKKGEMIREIIKEIKLKNNQ